MISFSLGPNVGIGSIPPSRLQQRWIMMVIPSGDYFSLGQNARVDHQSCPLRWLMMRNDGKEGLDPPRDYISLGPNVAAPGN